MYENVTYESILKRMLDRVSEKMDKREGSVIWDTHSPTAIELQILYLELDTILRESYGDTASREFLILRCKERGIVPYQATQARLKGVFTPTDIDVSGQRFHIGTVTYRVCEKIADGEYQVQCETPGRIGNQYLGLMVPIEYIKGLQTAELTKVLIPGEDEEETDQLRQRYFTSFHEKAFGGNEADYIGKVNAIAGVGKTKVTRVWNGDCSPADLIPSKTVQQWYESSIESLDDQPAAWLTAVYHAAKEKKLTIGGTILLTIVDSTYRAASDTLVQTVQNVIDPDEYAGSGYGIAPIGHVVLVRSATEVEITVCTTITFDVGYGWNNLHQTIETAVSDYLSDLRETWADSPSLVIRIRQIENCILNLQGVLDLQDTTINGLAENLTLGAYEIPVLGGVIHE